MTSQFGSGVSYAGLPNGVLDVVSRNPLPALIVEVPSERVVAVSPAAQDLFSSRRRRLVGCTLESLTAETPKGALDLLVAGRLNGYEANHQFRLGDGSSVPLQTWVRTIGEEIPLRHVLFLFTTEGMPAASTAPALPKEFNALIGTIDASLRIDRVCNDGDTSLDGPMGLVGQSIFQIVHLEDLTGLMWALAQSTSTAKGVALHVHVHRGHGQAQLCQMLLLPMDPPPTFAFALRSVEQSETSPESEVDALLGATRGHDVFGSSHSLASISQPQIPGMSELSSRELDVLTRLLAGYRVPAIAKVLFISQSTVRNHLSAIFRKLNVESQQELIDLLRI